MSDARRIHEWLRNMRDECISLRLDNEAKDARIKELEAEVVTLALCEQDHVILAPGKTYRFEVISGCKACEKLQEQLDR